MRYVIERMALADVPRVAEIEALSFPTPWPPGSYRKELQDNPMAHYIVLRDTALEVATPPPAPVIPRRAFPLSLLPARHTPPIAPRQASIVGFAGLWQMINEAHITIIAVHPQQRGRSLGELLLCALVGLAGDISARIVSLEVRVSNGIAQNLYRKYGFNDAGIRRRYYSDNGEDALIMWTDDITTPAYRDLYDRLRTDLTERLNAVEGTAGASAS